MTILESITGVRFGRFIVLGPSCLAKSGDRLAACLCDCGIRFESSPYHIKRGRVKSCGCLYDSRRLKLVGRQFGRLAVVKAVGRNGHGQALFACNCNCGNSVTVLGTCLRRGDTRSCGCFKKEKSTTHGKSLTREYTIWKAMNQRCYNPKNDRYAHYGQRGIMVCRDWRNSFEAFFADMGPCPPHYSIDRLDNDGNYEKENCRWSSASEQVLNQRRNRLVTFGGEVLPLTAMARKYGFSKHVLLSRLNAGWTETAALTTPVGGRNHV